MPGQLGKLPSGVVRQGMRHLHGLDLQINAGVYTPLAS